jgi:hypothetical protein
MVQREREPDELGAASTFSPSADPLALSERQQWRGIRRVEAVAVAASVAASPESGKDLSRKR